MAVYFLFSLFGRYRFTDVNFFGWHFRWRFFEGVNDKLIKSVTGHRSDTMFSEGVNDNLIKGVAVVMVTYSFHNCYPRSEST